jgi:hypothetical protein
VPITHADAPAWKHRRAKIILSLQKNGHKDKALYPRDFCQARSQVLRIQDSGLGFPSSNGDINAGFTERSQGSPVNSGIRVCDAADDSFHLGGNQSFSARRRAFTNTSVATGFQINVDSSTYREIPGFFESQQFCVLDAFVAVKAHTYDDATLHNNRPD